MMRRPAAMLCCAMWACTAPREAAWDAPPPPPTPTTTLSPTQPLEKLASTAEKAWQARSDRRELERAISMWEKLSAEDPENVDLLTRLSRAYFLLADGFVRRASQNGQSLALYDKGIAAGERAMLAVSEEFAKRVHGGEPVESAIAAIPASGQAALFWYASNLGRFVSADLTTAAMYKDRIHVVMQRVLKLDPTFFYAAPHRYFGAFYARAPHFLGGNLEKSKEHFERALQIEPHCLETKVLYAEYYARKVKDQELFVRLLTEVIQADPQALPDLLPEQEIAKQRARELLKNHERLFK